jgi:hypothetical protein
MEEAFGIVLFVVVGVGLVCAIWAITGVGKIYDQVGKGAFSLDRESDAPGPARRVAPENDPARDDEIRQMLTARNARRAAQGREQVDVEAELAALTRPAADPELEAEVRDLVLAKNHRRLAKGLEPLDVEAEVQRQLRGLGG